MNNTQHYIVKVTVNNDTHTFTVNSMQSEAMLERAIKQYAAEQYSIASVADINVKIVKTGGVSI